MKGTLGEIRIFAGDFEPKDWAFCKGKRLLIHQYAELYSVIGKSYGGDDKTYFSLPDLRSKAAVGAGQAPGLSKYDLGQKAGAEAIAITEGQMPNHIHLLTYSPGDAGSTTASLYGTWLDGNSVDPGGRLLAAETKSGVQSYASGNTADTDLVDLNEDSIQFTQVAGPRLTGLTLSPIGSGGPHNNVQPSLALNYIICIHGDLPPKP